MTKRERRIVKDAAEALEGLAEVMKADPGVFALEPRLIRKIAAAMAHIADILVKASNKDDR